MPLPRRRPVVAIALLSTTLAAGSAPLGCATAPPPPPPATGATAPRRPPPGPSFETPLPTSSLRGGDDLVLLCDRLRDEGSGSFVGNEVERERARSAQRSRREEAAEQLYVAEVPAPAFAFNYDLGEQRLSVVTKSFALAPGAEIYPADPERRLTFALAPEVAERIAREHAAGAVALRLLFKPDASSVRQELCLRLGGGIVKLSAALLAGALVGAKGETLARVETEEYGEARAALLPVKSPQVTVGRPTRADRREVPQALVSSAEALGPRLLPCYQEALAAAPRLRGTLVVGARLTADGRLEGARMEVSALKHEGLVTCVIDNLRKAKIGPAGGAVQISLPITFGGE